MRPASVGPVFGGGREAPAPSLHGDAGLLSDWERPWRAGICLQWKRSMHGHGHMDGRGCARMEQENAQVNG